MQRRFGQVLETFKKIGPAEALAEIKHKMAIYDQEPLVLGACWMIAKHTDLDLLSDDQVIALYKECRDAFAEFEEFFGAKTGNSRHELH
ncbi:MAG: hypothetical protein JJ902_18340 [Roseibium sp.]|nr:hypothetical protein [Roseibium sp.]